ncbi:hypothetical protein BJY21_001686 [Kineosphaera limosa]|uniref:DUF1579 domain-containing protein n=1 Tax=Kineosphaera limosa NBRC 100340 TaxID=1184609 RepID=K6WSE9_9MICO|nr:hypothetical protein [Kineosphaera limosa]NYE00502.1 hypothetical protein [Kineosphaera limosa]GAB95032.1 hypothetical protein KILIM_015_00940 [Kineosphaera limosa NBRC 100340]
MTGPWGEIVGAAAGQARGGEGGFRLMPDDEMAFGEASATVEAPAGGFALTLTYTWTHPDDGLQDGVLLVGSPQEGADTVEATWLDSWHQKPAPLHLTGALDGSALELSALYSGNWGWQIRLDLTSPQETVLVMRHVIPSEALDQAPPGTQMPAGPYDVMDLRLR